MYYIVHFRNKAEDASLKQKLMEGLLRVSSNIVRSNRFCTSSQSKNLLLDSYQNVNVSVIYSLYKDIIFIYKCLWYFSFPLKKLSVY